MRRKWTEGEVAYLREWYGKKSGMEIARELGRSKSMVYTKAAALKLNGRPSLWKDEEVQFLQENYLVLGAEETARRLNRTLSSVHTKIREVGGGRPGWERVLWTEEEEQYLRENYQGTPLEEMENHLGRTKNAIFARAQVLGVQRYIDPYPFFENWSEESAYFVGFFAADGWVLKRGPESIRIGVSQKESDIVYRLQEVIGTGRIITKSDGMHEYYVHSVKLYEWLCNLFGHDVHKKSHSLKWPKIPDEYARHFFRGAFDGDGSFFSDTDGLWRTSYATSSKAFAHSLADNLFRLTGIVLGLGLNKIGVWHARTSGIRAVCLADWLYRDCSIALERKAKIAQKMMETVGIARMPSITPKMQEMFPHIINSYTIWDRKNDE